MRVGIVVPTYDQYASPEAIFRLFQELENLGYDSAWFGDHILVPSYATAYTPPDWYDAVTCAIAGMAKTSRLAFGTDVLVAPYRNPVLLAKMAVTACALSGSRLTLGLGVGYLKGEFRATGAPPIGRRGAVTDEYLKAMRTLFETRGPVSFSGEWINFEDCQFGPFPDAMPPLLVGGNHDRAHERAALLGDGWHPLFATPQEYARGRARILALRAEAGIARPFLFSYSAANARVLYPGESPPVIPAYGDEAPDDFSYAPDFDLADDGRQRFVGTPAQLREDFATLAAAGVEQIILRFATPRDAEMPLERHIEQLHRFAADVLPICRTL